MSRPVIRIQNVYGDFLRSFKVLLDELTMNSLNKIEWNYGSKTLQYHALFNGKESFEFPVALIDIQDIQPTDSVGAISRNPRLNPQFSNHNIEIAGNETLQQTIILDKRWMTMMFNVTINTEDVASLLNFHDMIVGNLPMNFMFYDRSYYSYIEVTEFVKDWDFDNHTIDNVFTMMDPTYRYDPVIKYNESNEAFFETKERDRQAGRDPYPELEGKRYYSMVKSDPIYKLTSVQKTTDKEQMHHSLNLSFEAQLEIPNLLMGHLNQRIESIELVIDTVSKNHQTFPILIDMPENFLTNKNISRGILLSSDDFVIPDDAVWEPIDPNDPPNLTKYPHLRVNQYIDTVNKEVPSLWAVEDVTETSASRFFIPLKHATVQYVRDENNQIKATLFYFKEMLWFDSFDFDNPFNYLKLVLFNADAQPIP